MLIEGLQFGYCELYWRTKPRGFRNDFFLHIFAKNLENSICILWFELLTTQNLKRYAINI